jgi:hypothetical protein
MDKESYGDQIAHRLNSATPSPSVFRIRALIERLKAYSESSARLESFCLERKLMRSDGAAVFTASPLGYYKLTDPEVSVLAAEILNIAEELKSLRARYRWRRGLRVNPDGTLEDVYLWSQVDDSEAAWENESAMWLFSQLPTLLQGNRPFAHFQRCERCGDWFYAGRNGAKFCKDACRVLSHVQTDEGKESRARYMRKLRKQKSDRERERKKAESRSKSDKGQRMNTSISTNTKQRKVKV